VKIRPLRSTDLQALMSTVGILVDSLYPQGAEKLFARLENALNGYATANVVESLTLGPIALASETLKGADNVKVSTFWVHQDFRGRGIGGRLLDHRLEDWRHSNRGHAIVTVREDRAAELERLFTPRGFTRVAVDIDRYGDGQNEVILKWTHRDSLPLAARYVA